MTIPMTKGVRRILRWWCLACLLLLFSCHFILVQYLRKPDMTTEYLVFQDLSERFINEICDVNNTNKCHRNGTLGKKLQCTHFMSLSKQNGGRIGNRLFQVAALLGVARYHGYTAILDRSDELFSVLHLFDLPKFSKNIKLSMISRFEEKACCKFDERATNLSHDTNWTLRGYLQSWRYFEGAEDDVRRTLKLKKEISEDAKTLISSTVSPGTVTVSIHIRRGDFTAAHMISLGYKIAPLSYIKKAMEYFVSKYKLVHFFVVSDDITWCKKYLSSNNVTISPFLFEVQDMALMVESDHVVVTAGSFGWWGAWLSGGEVVYWTGFPEEDSIIGAEFNARDYYPGHWIGFS